MTDKSGDESAPSPAPSTGDDCPLPVAQQRRNIFLYGTLWAMYYLAAPITYVGVTHAYILNELKASDFVANLPSAAYLWMSALPIVFAFFFPQPKLAKPVLVSCLLLMATISFVVAAALFFRVSPKIWIALIIAHGLILGIGNGLAFPAMWDILRRSVASSRRGAVMGLAFGAGPIFACVGSLGQQIILFGSAHGYTFGKIDFPDNCALLFGILSPVLFVAMTAAASFIVPPPPVAAEESSATRAAKFLEGSREFFTTRPVFLGVVCYALVYAGGNTIMQTVSLAAPEKIAAGTKTASADDHASPVSTAVATKELPEIGPDSNSASNSAETSEAKSASKASDVKASKPKGTVGYQNELRFGFKAVAGLLLGWLLSKSHPKAALLATTSTLIVALFWALSVEGPWYLFSMGLLGAGELFGAYYPNYVVSASRKARVRLNVTYVMLIGSFVGFAPVMFGWISDHWGRQASIWTATGLLIGTMMIVLVGLPSDPRPHDDETVAAES